MTTRPLLASTSLLLATLFLASCAQIEVRRQPYEIYKDHFAVDYLPTAFATERPRITLEKRAHAFCAQQGKKLRIVGESATKMPLINYNDTTRLIFVCE